MLVALQPPRQRTVPALIQRLLKKRNKRKVVRDWKEDGCRVGTCVDHLEARQTSQYLQWTKELLGSCHVWEIALDSTMFATKDTQVHICFAPAVGIAAYAPPVVLRQLRWRKGGAMESMTEQELARFEKHGFRAQPRMQAYDCIRSVNHVLQVTLGTTLLSFQAAAGALGLMPPGGVRIREPQESRWLRMSKSLDSRVPASGSSFEAQPELPDALINPKKVPFLILTMDQKQSQWTAAHFMCDQRGRI